MLGIQMAGPLLPPHPAVDAGATAAAAGSARRHDSPPGNAPSPTGRERDAWLQLVGVSGVGPVTISRLLECFGSASRAVEMAGAEPREFAERLGQAETGGDGTADRRIPLDLGDRIVAQAAAAAALAARVEELGLSVVTLDDPAYPERLRAVEFPPPVLFVLGSLAALRTPHAVAIVGTRRATEKGRRLAAWIASAVGRLGASVVSGLAIGVDGAAHAAAVTEGSPTVAVLGGGHARLFPRAHARLAEAIVDAGGAVLSELAPDVPPTRGTFPRRNRIISGLADATVVVEAGAKSGALITAGWALEQGRECFIVPGAIDSPASAGCNAFLREFPGQARVVCGVPELLEDLGLTSARNGTATSPAAVLATLTELEAVVAARIREAAASADQIAAATGLPVSTILSTLTLLELRGLVVSAYGRYSAAGALAAWPGGIRGPAGARR